MVDLIIENDYKGYMIYRLLDGNKKAIVLLTKENYQTLDEVIDYINSNYEYARILCGRNIY